MLRRLVLVLTALLVCAAAAQGAPTARTGLPASFHRIESDPAGGSVWLGVIPGSTRESAVYLPRLASGRRYPVVYLLHGMRGSPAGFTNALHLGTVADTQVGTPFIAVMPVAGPNDRYDGEWAGPWEDFVVRHVVPWTDATLPTIATQAGRTIAGLSAGGFGAVDIALRHPGLFGRVESWSGYFKPIADGPLQGASAAVLARHDPTRLVRAQAGLLRGQGVRFLLATGPDHAGVQASDTVAFGRLLTALHLPVTVLVLPPAQALHPWASQLLAGLRWALG